jgi:hypothetical protein
LIVSLRVRPRASDETPAYYKPKMRTSLISRTSVRSAAAPMMSESRGILVMTPPRKNYADREESVGLGCPAGENIQCVRRIAGSVSSLGDEAAHVYEPNDLGVQSSRADCERLSRWSQASFHPLRTRETREQT